MQAPSKYRSHKKRAAEWEVAVERPAYDLTIFKLPRGGLTLKIYSKGERVLRIESVSITRESFTAVARWTNPRSSATEGSAGAICRCSQLHRASFIADQTL